MPKRHAWETWPTSRVLDLRLCDLDVRIEGTWLERCLVQLFEELGERGIRLRPATWLGDEWYSPSNAVGFAIPFYLAHPRLMRIERSKILEVEGGTQAECMRIMRHETGHVLQHAYGLHRRRSWQELFGKSSTPYPTHYRPNPVSKKYVQHLRLWYAQAHPDEDFAETFAVWLRRRSNWRVRYAGWAALKKLEYVDDLVPQLSSTRLVLRSRAPMDPISTQTMKLKDYYERKRAYYSVASSNVYDRDLRRLFKQQTDGARTETASAFLRRNRRWIRHTVSQATGEHELALDYVLSDMIGRCRELRLMTHGDRRKLRVDFAVALTVHTMHALYNESRRSWFAL